jgi:hypothetical protein
MFLDDSRRGIKDKLTKEERRYFNIVETWFYISSMVIYYFLLAPFFE